MFHLDIQKKNKSAEFRIEARHLQFGCLQIIEDFLTQYAFAY